MLASPFEAEDAVQETFIRAWKGYERFEGRAALRSWLYRIATNVCLDMLSSRERRARPMDLGPAREPVLENLATLPEITWVQPAPDGLVVPEGDPADVAVARDTIRLAFVAALQHLPPRQRAVLLLCEVLRWQASEVAELLETTVASVNSALQRARATLAAADVETGAPAADLEPRDRELLARYVEAFERYDIDALTTVIQEDATQSMPPYDLWLSGREDIFRWWFGPGIGCRGSRVIPATPANGSPAYGQYKPAPDGGYEPWALQVVEISGGRIAELTFFLETETLFPLFGLPPRLEREVAGSVGEHRAQAHQLDQPA
jgi:RNA polymerase sigma-70 factor (ECF subfamily)